MGWGRGPASDTPVGGAGTTALATSPTGPLAASRYPAMADALAGVGLGGLPLPTFRARVGALASATAHQCPRQSASPGLGLMSPRPR